MIDLVRTEKEDELVGHLGPDLLGPDWDADLALANLRADPDAPIGDALLDQRNLAGVGNVFKSELCFLGGVDPLTPVGAVPDLAADRRQGQAAARGQQGPRHPHHDRRPPPRQPALGLRPTRAVRALRHRGSRKADQGPPGQERPTYWCPRCQPARAG